MCLVQVFGVLQQKFRPVVRHPDHVRDVVARAGGLRHMQNCPIDLMETDYSFAAIRLMVTWCHLWLLTVPIFAKLTCQLVTSR